MKNWTRRQILRGTGVALALPWLETFAPRTVRAQAAAAAVRKRYVAMYFPNGTAGFWHGTGVGAGNAWQLGPIQQPFAPIKEYVTILNNISNYSPHGGHAEPSHSNDAAATWTCVRPWGAPQGAPATTPAAGTGPQKNGISVDQLIANGMMGQTPLHSLQVGLTTLESSPDGLPGQHSRSMSWKDENTPLFKLVSPAAVFDRLMGGGTGMSPMSNVPLNDPIAMRRRALNKSAIDYILGQSTDLQKKLSVNDRLKMDQFLSSVRTLEKRVADTAMQLPPPISCRGGMKPTEAYGVGNTPAGYSRQHHGDLMIDLVAMAFACDITRSVNFMLDDARSDFAYSFLPQRNFTTTGSTPGTGTCGSYHGLQHAGELNNGFATIGWWNATMATQLAQKLMMIQEGDKTVLDNSLIVFASGMKGGNHDSRDIPIALIGGSAGVLKRNNLIDFGTAQGRLVDVHTTYLQKLFGVMTPFGTPVPVGVGKLLPELLA